MDSLAALALATELPKPSLLERMPQDRNDYIVSRKMTKHILGQAVFHCIVLFFFLFAGEFVIPEPDVARRHGRDSTMVYPGRFYDWNGEPLYEEFSQEWGPSRHLTFIFNAFVIMQIFNMICSRKIHDEWNIFSGIFTNIMFCILWLVIFGGQVLIVQFSGRIFVVCTDGLTIEQWGFSILVGLTVFIINALLKLVPDFVAPSLGQDSVYQRKYQK